MMAQCIYSSWQGLCSMFCEDKVDDGLGCDKQGLCWAEEDPDPNYGCHTFESADPEWEAEEWE